MLGKSRIAESEESRATRKKIHTREILGKSRIAALFQWFVVLEGGKVGSPKRRVPRPVQQRNEKLHAPVARTHFQVQMYKTQHAYTTFWSSDVEIGRRLWREARVQVKMYKTHQRRTTFWSSDVEKWHKTVAQTTCGSQTYKTQDA